MKRIAFSRRAVLGLAAAACALLPGGAAQAQDFYAGKRILLIVGAPPDGSYATYSRTLANHMVKHIPGSPTIELEYRGGGDGGLSTSNYLDAAAPKDGSVFATTQQTIPVNQFLRPESARYDVTKWAWIGGIAPVRNMLALWQACPAKTLEDAKTIPTKVGATSKSSPMFIVPQMLNHFLGTKFEIILGYDGVAGTNLAMEQGEICGRGASWVSVLSGAPHYAQQKLLVPIVVDGATRDPDLPDVPTMLELATTPEQKQAFEIVAASATFGRSYFFPAGVPQEAVDIMRKAFDETMKDPDFLAEAKAQKIAVEPVSADTLKSAVESLAAIPPETLKTAADVMAGK